MLSWARRLQIQDLLGVFGEDLAGGGERDLGSQPVKERGIQLLLELANLRADRRLRAVTRLRRFGETLQADNFEKRVQLIQIHDALDRQCQGVPWGSDPIVSGWDLPDDVGPVVMERGLLASNRRRAPGLHCKLPPK